MGVTCAKLVDRAVEILDVRVGDRAGSVLQHLVKSCAGAEPTILALDAPLGWPAALGPALVAHTAGSRIPAEANTLFRRRTDAYVKENLDRQSLDVGADRIARTAHSALRLLNDVAERLSKHIPLAWEPQISGLAAIEVYPAATLAAYAIPARAYKDSDSEPARKAIVQRLEQLVILRCTSEILFPRCRMPWTPSYALWPAPTSSAVMPSLLMTLCSPRRKGGFGVEWDVTVSGFRSIIFDGTTSVTSVRLSYCVTYDLVGWPFGTHRSKNPGQIWS